VSGEAYKNRLLEQNPVSTPWNPYNPVMESSQPQFETVELVDSMHSIEFDADEGTYRAEYNTDRDQPSLAIVAMIAAVAGSDPTELPPLHSAIDTGALDSLFSATPAGGHRSGRLSFLYEGFEVSMSSEGTIVADPVGPT